MQHDAFREVGQSQQNRRRIFETLECSRCSYEFAIARGFPILRQNKQDLIRYLIYAIRIECNLGFFSLLRLILIVPLSMHLHNRAWLAPGR